MEYQPGKCQKKYRAVIVRKNLSVKKGETVLFEEYRYFFYLTNRKDKAAKSDGVLPKNSADLENGNSRGFPIIVVEHPAQFIAAADAAHLGKHVGGCRVGAGVSPDAPHGPVRD